MKADISSAIGKSIKVKQTLLEDDSFVAQLEQLVQDCLSALHKGGKIIFAGNGGSFADAQHLSAEFTSRFLCDRSPLPSLALCTNSSAMSAIGNDYGYDQVFSRELRAIAGLDDVFIGISTSGNSSNIFNALEVAAELGIRNVAWTGKTGGKLVGRFECLHVPSTDTARIQECHILMGHILCELVEREYFGISNE